MDGSWNYDACDGLRYFFIFCFLCFLRMFFSMDCSWNYDACDDGLRYFLFFDFYVFEECFLLWIAAGITMRVMASGIFCFLCFVLLKNFFMGGSWNYEVCDGWNV